MEQMTEQTNRRKGLAGLNAWLLGIIVILLGVVIVRLMRPAGPGSQRPAVRSLPGYPGETGPPEAPEKVKAAEGVVMGFRNNPHLDVNALQVRVVRSGVLAMAFRPHTAQAVMTIAAVNDSVQVEYTSNPNDEVVGYRLKRITNLRTGRSVTPDELPPPPDVPANHPAEFFTVKQPELITDEYGGIVAIRSDHLLFHFKPGLVDEILPLIRTAGTVGLSAVWRDDHFGFVNVDNDKVYVVLSVTIDNKTFLVR